MSPVIRKIRIQIPSAYPRGIADVVDAESNQPLGCQSFDLHADLDGNITLKLQLIDVEAMVVGTRECRKVEEPL